MVEPLAKAIAKAKPKSSKVILISPEGQKFSQQLAQKWAKEKSLTFVSGYYEGFDARVKNYVNEEVSLGDFIISRGDLAIMPIVDAIVRVKKDVINQDSIKEESFNNNLLEYDQYTFPQEYQGKKVPEILISGHHKKIAEFRQENSLKKTQKYRPDLYNEYKEKKDGC